MTKIITDNSRVNINLLEENKLLKIQVQKLIERIKRQIDHEKEKEVNRASVKDYSGAIYHSNRQGAFQDLLFWVKQNEGK